MSAAICFDVSEPNASALSCENVDGSTAASVAGVSAATASEVSAAISFASSFLICAEVIPTA